ncbi:hypothetical protein [Streptomyces griseofuscus]|uniref:hypothetical protein n=1 Tax=Streptomyces griseofuscus TaxID=146922 RepID=UPI0033CB3C9F
MTGFRRLLKRACDRIAYYADASAHDTDRQPVITTCSADGTTLPAVSGAASPLSGHG